MKISLLILTVLMPFFAQAHVHSFLDSEILIGTDLLEHIGGEAIASDAELGVSVARVNAEQMQKIHRSSHDFGRCGGFELLTPNVLTTNSLNGPLVDIERAKQILETLKKAEAQSAYFHSLNFLRSNMTQFDEKIQEATEQVQAENLMESVNWLSSFRTRYHRSQNKNDHVLALKEKLEAMSAQVDFPVEISTIEHSNTPQWSLKMKITGSTRPDELVVMGGHLDSTVGFFSGNSPAPGADDNASGSSNLIEAARILLAQGQPQRSIEIFWYAGEEGGLLGSAQIAQSYKAENKDVIGVLQLDMTLVAGSGEFTLGSMNDFTSAWLRELLVELNTHYIGAEIIDSQCGYGCSDHASWHRQGFPALMPFESTMEDINGRIHTSRDIIDTRSSFEHSAMFSKIAVAFAMQLGNSELRHP